MKPQFLKPTALVSAMAAVSIVGSHNTLAQQDGSKLEEIVVTATARQQSMQEIPYNISAVTGEDLSNQSISNETDLLRAMSGATVVDRGARNSGVVNSIAIRGLNVGGGNEGDNALNAVATVSTYVDNTPMYAGFVIRDLARVELLRGPQGTLYGSGALGGTVRMITNKPSTDGVEGSVDYNYSQTKYSEGHNQSFDAMVNIPLSDNLALRAHAGRIDNDGIIDAPNLYQLSAFGEPLAAVNADGSGGCIDPRSASAQQVLENPPCISGVEDVDTVEQDYARIALKFEPLDSLSFLLAYQMQDEEYGGRRAVTEGTNGNISGIPNYDVVYDDDEIGITALEDGERDVDLLSLDIEWDMGFATLTSTTAQFEDNGVGYRDQMGLYASGGGLAQLLYRGNPRAYARTESGYETETLVQEFRLVSNATDSKIDWLAGLFYLDEEKLAFNDNAHAGMNVFHEACLAAPGADPFNPATLPANCQTFWPVTGFLYGLVPGLNFGPYDATIDENDYTYRRNADFEEIAIYGELTYHISDALHLTGGLRYFDNEQKTVATGGFPTSENGAIIGSPVGELNNNTSGDNDLLVKVNIAYDISEDLMSYATYSQGYRRGGANALPASGPFFEDGNLDVQNFDKDTVENYEVGIKGQYDTVSFSVAAFYVDWEDPQLNVATPVNGFLYAANGDGAHTAGIESEVNGIINENWGYRLSYTFTEAELDGDLVSAFDGDGDGNLDVSAEDGEFLPSTPKHVFSMALNGYWQLAPDIDLSSNISAYFQDEQKNALDSNSSYAEVHDEFWIFNASLALSYRESWRVTLYGTNLGNEEGVTSSQPNTVYSGDVGDNNSWYGNTSFRNIAQPRTYGLKVGYEF